MTFGVLSTGFSAMRMADIVADLQAAFQSQFGTNVRLDAESPNGQFIGIMAERIALVWEAAEAAYNAADPRTASGIALDRLLELVSLTRLPASKSAVGVTITGTPGAVIPAGSSASVGATGALFDLAANATIGGAGTVSATFVAEQTGPIPALAGTLTTIRTPVTGWTSVVNPLDAVVGSDLESDAALRIRQAQFFASVAASTSKAIYAALSKITGVTEVVIVENRKAIADSDGRPPNSFECVVLGGDDQTIANTIWATKPAGIAMVGSTSMTVVDSLGNGHTVKFSRPADVLVWVSIDLTVASTFPVDGVAQVLAAVLSDEPELRIGQPVVPFHIVQAIDVAGINQLAIRVGTTSNPAASDIITIGKTARGLLDSSRVVITRLN